MAATLIVKITYGAEIRRFTYVNEPALNWGFLSKRVSELFELPKKAFKLTYVDDEGDKITFSTDAELCEAVKLALAVTPSVLRLGVLMSVSLESKSTSSSADVIMSDASTDPEAKKTADAGTTVKPITTDAATNGGTRTSDAGTDCGARTTDAGTDCAGGPALPAEYQTLFRTLARQLPGLASQLPEAVRALIPHAELDVAATIAANAASNAAAVAAEAATQAANQATQAAFAAAGQAASAAANATSPPMADGFAPMAGAHPGVRCDRTGVSPIIGNRYNLAGHNYDLCEEEFLKLSEKERALYVKIPPPPPPPIHRMDGHGNGTNGGGATAASNNGGAPADPHMQGVHPGVECDRSGMCPIVGIRYNLKNHDYDLCQAEFDKLPSTEKLMYTPIPPRASVHDHSRPWGFGRSWGGGGGGGGFGCGNGFGRGGAHAAAHAWAGPGRGCFSSANSHPCGGPGMMGGNGGNKLAARFVRDVSIFDGTQMGAATTFTKIWRLKNSGEVPWPPGTRMLFVGGDQMTREMSVPLSRDGAVCPGEEVDVAVEMVAPLDLGRYLGYWRLMGPRGRKFGQRVWCHIQVVDPAAPEDATVNVDLLAAEIQKKKLDLAASEPDPDPADPADEDLTTDATTKEGAGQEADVTAALGAVEPPIGAKRSAADDEAHMSAKLTRIELTDRAADAPALPAAEPTDYLSDVSDSVLVSAGGDEVEVEPSAASATASATASAASAVDLHELDTTTPAGVLAALGSMGFTDAKLIEAAVQKHGTDLAACARDLALLSGEWDPLLDDLAEMGFSDRALNQTLMIQHDGNLKRTVKALVEDHA